MKCKKCKKECLENELTDGICKECMSKTETQTKSQEQTNSNGIGCLVVFIIIAIIIFAFVSWWNNLGNDSSDSNSNGQLSDIELMSYAQTVLDDNLSNPQYSSSKKDYNFVNTGLKYKIEGEVTTNGKKENFYMIIEFTDENYEEYDLISLQVGNKDIY